VTRRLILRDEAEHDLAIARDWYDKQRWGLGTDFLIAVDDAFARITNAPELFAPGYKSVRACALNRFPYVVRFRLITDAVEVLAVQHGKRHPNRWKSRA